MKGNLAARRSSASFELGMGTVLVEPATSAASAGAHICVLWSHALRRGARWYRCGAFPLIFPLRAHSASRGFETAAGSAWRAVQLGAQVASSDRNFLDAI